MNVANFRAMQSHRADGPCSLSDHNISVSLFRVVEEGDDLLRRHIRETNRFDQALACIASDQRSSGRAVIVLTRIKRSEPSKRASAHDIIKM